MENPVGHRFRHLRPTTSLRLVGDEARNDRVMAFSSRPPPVSPERKAFGLQGSGSAVILRFGLNFTVPDHAALAAWANDSGHGYDRLHIDRASLADGGWASYALIYVPGQAWSTWGVTRRDNQIEVWRCATGRTVYSRARMTEALVSLPHATDSAGATHGRRTDQNPRKPDQDR